AGARHMRLRVVLNARSGTLRDLDPDEVAARISDLCRAAGHDATVVAAAPDTVPAELRAAAAADIDAVIVGGGDGTVSSAANLLAGTGKALGVLPLGTMNLFARDLDLPTEWEAALAALI